MSSIERLRKKVRESDEKTIRTIGTRMSLTDELGRIKESLGAAVYDPRVESANVANAVKLAEELRISPATAESVMRTVIAESRLRQEAARSGKQLTCQNVSWRFPSPQEFKAAVPRSAKAAKTVEKGRKDIGRILDGKDRRKILILGPCSVHDPGQAKEYAELVRSLQKKADDRFLLVMRVYVEKSRSKTGWTGYLGDPYLDGTGDVQEGIAASRKLLNGISELGVPAAVEYINSSTAQYIGDLVSWAAVGARSSGSQMHRDMASGLDVPVGFKNGLDGSTDAAIGAIGYAGRGHTFLGADDSGHIGAVRTRGNTYCHLVMRGGEKPNYFAKNVKAAQKALKTAGLRSRLIVDCSHGNSGKKAKNQPAVFRNVIGQNNPDIVGLMLESNLKPGKQLLPEVLAGFDSRKLKPGISVTDECLGWKETEKLVLSA